MVTTIDYFSVVSAGDATDFGDLTQTRGEISTAGNSTRAIWAGGRESASPGAQSNIIDYVTIASVGNASDFGDLTAVRRYPGGTSNQQRGVFGGGDTPSSTDVMDYIAIAATSVAADFDEIWLWACNHNTSAETLTLEWGGVTSTDDLMKTVIQPNETVLVAPGWMLKGNASTALLIQAFSTTINKVSIIGHVNRIDAA